MFSNNYKTDTDREVYLSPKNKIQLGTIQYILRVETMQKRRIGN